MCSPRPSHVAPTIGSPSTSKISAPPRPATDSVAVIGPSAFLTLLWASDPALVRIRLREQAEDIGIPFDLLLQRLAKLVDTVVELDGDTGIP